MTFPDKTMLYKYENLIKTNKLCYSLYSRAVRVLVMRAEGRMTNTWFFTFM